MTTFANIDESVCNNADQSTTLFLGDLSVFCTEKDIRKLFRLYGQIEAIRVKRGSSNKANLSYGFIKFSSRDSAEWALSELTGVMFLGRALRLVYLFSSQIEVELNLFLFFRIGWAEAKNAPFKVIPSLVNKDQQHKPETAQLHVSFMSKQVSLSLIF